MFYFTYKMSILQTFIFHYTLQVMSATTKAPERYYFKNTGAMNSQIYMIGSEILSKSGSIYQKLLKLHGAFLVSYYT